jgi:ATP-binding cassette subfamily B (MDR/TAP) protein 1
MLSSSSLNLAEKADIPDSLNRPYIRPTRRGLTKSRLRGPFYLLSFAPSFPAPLQNYRAALAHPYTLYAIGTIAAIVAGIGLPAFDLLYGYWTNGITAAGAEPSAINSRGSQTGWLMAIVAVVTLTSFVIFLGCCKHHSFRINLLTADGYNQL